jgi:hypothetical protein
MTVRDVASPGDWDTTLVDFLSQLCINRLRRLPPDPLNAC